MSTQRAALSWAISELSKNSIDSPELTAELLLGFVLKLSRLDLHTSANEVLSKIQLKNYQKIIAQRIKHIPLQHLTGTAAFLDFELKVNKNVLIPRPETEEVFDFFVSQFLKYAHADTPILDLGTGSGALAIALARKLPKKIIHACDISVAALKVARANAKHLGVSSIRWYRGDFLKAFPASLFKNPVWIVCNPPYIGLKEKKELSQEVLKDPSKALLAGSDGLNAYRTLAEQISRLLCPGSVLISEIGYSQKKSVSQVFNHIFKKTEIHSDLSGNDRIFYGIDSLSIS